MSIANIIFLTVVCLGYGVFMITLASAAWYCRDSLVEAKAASKRLSGDATISEPRH